MEARTRGVDMSEEIRNLEKSIEEGRFRFGDTKKLKRLKKKLEAREKRRRVRKDDFQSLLDYIDALEEFIQALEEEIEFLRYR